MRQKQIMLAVVDGQGGGVGRTLIEQIKKSYPDVYVRALGTNAVATANMMKGGADDGATGENAIVFNAEQMQLILGPIAIISANGLLGEVTPAMAAAIGGSKAMKILIPSQRCKIRLAIGEGQTLQAYIKDAIRLLGEELQELSE